MLYYEWGDTMKKALLVGLDYYKGQKIITYMQELKALAETLNIDVFDSVTQDNKQASPQFKIGSGKVQEIKALIDVEKLDLVIFNDELTGSQVRNLEEVLGVPVVDRTLLILDIFAKRAKTKEAMLQVEVAQLKYLLPRLTSLNASFERQQGGIGSRGPGEKKIEMDRRKIENELNTLENALKSIVTVRQSNRKYRQKTMIKTVAIVGYTNAGKSTLMNALINASNTSNNETKDVFVKDQLFATLETTSRRIELANTKPFLLTDTIGFVSNLPHDLVEAFKSTLEEIKEADLLLHVVDFSNPYYFDQILTTQKVLDELGASDIETLYVFNKIDLTDENVPHGFSPAVKISLTENKNIDLLITQIRRLLTIDDKIVTYKIPYSQGDIVNTLIEHSEILNRKYDEHGTEIKAKVSKILRTQLKDYEQ